MGDSCLPRENLLLVWGGDAIMETMTPKHGSRYTIVTLFVLFGFVASSARADIYTYTDKRGVVHFTNIRKKARKGRKWKVLYRTGPGKASAIRGCKRCDKVPARDTSPERYTRYDKYILGASRLYKIPVSLIKAVILAESDFDPRVVSSAGAKGLMQLMPVTARDMGVVNVFDPRENIYGGVRFLRVLANMFNGDLVLTIAGYHAGPGSIRKYRGIPPYKTTHQYVRAVLWRYYRYRKKALGKARARTRTQPRTAPRPAARRR